VWLEDGFEIREVLEKIFAEVTLADRGYDEPDTVCAQ